MAEKNDPEPTQVAPPEPEPKPTSIGARAKNKKKKKVRGYLTYLVGGEGTLALKQKVIKIGKDAASDILVRGWNIGKTAATISRTRNGYFFSYVSGLAKPKINDKRASKKPQKLSELDIISIGSTKLQFIGKKQTA
jgi:hypothetical protein